MTDTLFEDHTAVRVHAVCLGDRIDVRPLDVSGRLAVSPLVIRAGRAGCAAIFRYGVAVLFGLDPVEEASFLANLSHLVRDPHPKPTHEDTVLRINPEDGDRVLGNAVVLKEHTVERLQVVATVLAKSVALEYYEAGMAAGFERIEPLAVTLKMQGRTGRGAKRLLRDIGDALLIEHRMVSRVEIGEKPEFLWEHAEVEPLYLRLEQEYELRERRAALERKLGLISRTVETVLDLLNHKRSLRVEWYIVILIVVEIFLTLYSLFILDAPH